MKTFQLRALGLVASLSFQLQAAPLLVKDTKGREITISVTDFDAKTVTFSRGSKEFTVPWETFDAASIELIKSTPLPGADNKRQEREIELTLADGSKKKAIVPAGEYLSKAGALYLYPGDTVHLEFQDTDGKLKDPIVVAEVKNPARTLTFALTQDFGLTTLKRSGEIQQTVAVDAYAQILGQKAYKQYRDIYPTEKGEPNEFAWAEGAWHIKIDKIEVTEKSANDAYTERANSGK